MQGRFACVAFYLSLLFHLTGWAGTSFFHLANAQAQPLEYNSHLFLNRIQFEPECAQCSLNIEPGTPMDKPRAQQLAAVFRRQLIEDGYGDAKVGVELVPVGVRRVDLHLRVEPGLRYRVEEVRFSGNLGIKPEELQRGLHVLRPRAIVPGVWKSHPPFSDAAVEADLQRLRSLYISLGYFDAQVATGAVEYAHEKVTITVSIESGPRYGVRRVELAGAENTRQLSSGADSDFPVQALCRCLLAARRESEKEGRIDFSTRLKTEPAESPGEETASGNERSAPQQFVNLTAKVEPGLPYRVQRVEFRGNHSFSDSTLRRVFVLDEGELFDPARLLRSLRRLNRLGMFEPVTQESVEVLRDSSTRTTSVTIWLKQKPRGRWFLSGPVGPPGVAGPLQATIVSRLPALGPGVLETSTYYATLSVTAFYHPVFWLWSPGPRTLLLPLVGLKRPYLPGQEWKSGFLLSPQLGLRDMAAYYGITQLSERARTVLQGDVAITRSLAVPIERRGDRPGVLICEPTKSRWSWLRSLGTFAADFALP